MGAACGRPAEQSSSPSSSSAAADAGDDDDGDALDLAGYVVRFRTDAGVVMKVHIGEDDDGKVKTMRGFLTGGSFPVKLVNSTLRGTAVEKLWHGKKRAMNIQIVMEATRPSSDLGTAVLYVDYEHASELTWFKRPFSPSSSSPGSWE
jgi:hypothetical protein